MLSRYLRSWIYLIRQLLLIGCFMSVPYSSFAVIPDSCRQITLVSTGTTQNSISNSILREMYSALGYQIKQVTADSSAAAYELLAEGQADIYTSTWAPLDKNDLRPFALHGEVKTLHANLTEAANGLAVNRYGEIMGINDFEQLRDSAAVVNYTIFVGQADWHFAQVLQALIDSNIYGLSRFQVKRVHDFDLLTYLEEAQALQKPVVFFTRRPSIVSYRYAKYFLKDNNKFFKSLQTTGKVYTSVRYNFPAQCPNAASLLVRFEMTDMMQIDIIEMMIQSEISLAQAIRQWYQQHTSLVLSWLVGMHTADGKSARRLMMQIHNKGTTRLRTKTFYPPSGDMP